MKNPIASPLCQFARFLAALAGLALSLFPANGFAGDEEREAPNLAGIEEFLKEHLPEFSNQLQDLKHESWNEYVEGLERAADLMREFFELEERNGELAQMFLKQHRLEQIIDVLAEEWHEEEDEKKKDEIKQELHDTLADAFGLEQDMLPVEIEGLEEEIRELKQKLKERAENREQTISEAVEEILFGEDEVEEDGDQEDE
jgi:N-methylhydantoinase A/oxoprolinase/acetone carboxylase beta subunit